MRIVQISTTIGNAGVDKVVKALYDSINSNDDECVWAFGRIREGYKINIDRIYKIGGVSDILVHFAVSRLFDRSGFGSVLATKKLIHWLKIYNPDLIHLHSLLGYYINIPILFEYLQNSGTPCVWTQHDCWAFTGHCIHFESINCDKWKCNCTKCPAKNSYPTSLFLSNSKRNLQQKKRLFLDTEKMVLVSPSKWLDQYLSESFFKNKKHIVINNGIDISNFKLVDSNIRKENNIAENQRLVLAVASIWSGFKGIDDINYLADNIDNSDNKIVVVGKIPEGQKISEKILHIERTSNLNELIKWYSAADILVNPTYADNFPTVLIESIACGTPAVTYDTGGCSEIIDESCGKVIECGNVLGIINSINSMQIRKNEEISNLCMKRAKLFSKERMVENYIALYQEILSK